MTTTRTTHWLLTTLATAGLLVAATAQADPLPGRDLLKFSQQPMIATAIPDINGTVTTYGGHDEWSTAYGIGNAAQPTVDYQGRFMADDFADKLSTPIVHVKWWGSYRNDVIDQSAPVDKFLISFESDVPQTTANPFSRPGQPLLNQVVNRGALAPGSGTFTEKLIRGPVNGESLYEYNAELHLGKDFPELADTVYWLKIVAMVDLPQPFAPPFNNVNPPPTATLWGWHNRDYTIQNPLASNNIAGPPFPPGERLDGVIGANVPVWHFQDDAVTGDVRILAGPNGIIMPNVFQPPQNMSPTNYRDFADGPGPIPGTNFPSIGSFSKGLAFEIYTTQIPEPSTCALAGLGLAGVLMLRRRS